MEGFAEAALHGTPMTGADIDDGIASVRGMVAIARSVRSGQPVTLAEVDGPV
jgi:predicted dehydrogenase